MFGQHPVLLTVIVPCGNESDVKVANVMNTKSVAYISARKFNLHWETLSARIVLLLFNVYSISAGRLIHMK